MTKPNKKGFELKKGIEIDINAGWRKIIARQFGGDPGRAVGELIQNFIDSYPYGTDWRDRIAAIKTALNSFSITDWGEGISLVRFELLTTLGGTDKASDHTKIGQFGIGFFSIFNPALGTKQVVVTSRCKNQTVRLRFTVQHPEQRPNIDIDVLTEPIDFSTRIEVVFNNQRSPRRFLEAAKRCLIYYPCKVIINEMPFQSVWELARQRDAFQFKEGACTGFIESYSAYWDIGVKLLCKYELVGHLPLGMLITTKDNHKGDLQDFASRNMAYVSNIDITINVDNLRLTISRDGYYLDYAYQQMVGNISRALMRYLGRHKDEALMRNISLIVANHYTLSPKIRDHLKKTGADSHTSNEEETLIKFLAEVPVYALNGKRNKVSLKDIYRARTKDWPVYYAPEGDNMKWLGGAFKRDFIVKPPSTMSGGGAPDLHDRIFKTIFKDVINLDTIRDNQSKISELVERDIISQEALKPQVKVIRKLTMNQQQKSFLNELDALLDSFPVRKAIEKNLYLRVRKINAAFFSIKEKETQISTGLLDNEGRVIEENPNDQRRRNIHLGLRMDHPLIEHLIESKDRYRAYYALTFLAHELAKCQQLLIPYTRFFYFVARNLSADLRKGLILALLPEAGETDS